ncbi:hypothetical protein ACSQ67_021358 [Phaseolus vulgaris]
MIYRKWSLLTGPVTILGGVVAVIAAANVIFVKNEDKGTGFGFVVDFCCTNFFWEFFPFLRCSMCAHWILSSNQMRESMKINLLPSRRKEITEVCVLMSAKP